MSDVLPDSPETTAAIKTANANRMRRLIHLPAGAIPLGALAGTARPHPFLPDGWTGTTCLACFGWCSDPQHLGRPALVAS